jgi:DNA (cytosine-5)-methyltransferase 1
MVRQTFVKANGKPAYRVPLMAEIAKIKPCGLVAASTFSGCGGSSLGYKMAGFKVRWANEFIPAAAAVYRANHAGTILDTRDIRKIQPREILRALGMRAGQLDLLDGSPPCASFSMAGNREDDWAKEKKYSDTVQRTDDLFFEYVRILEGLLPKAFVAENVAGLVVGTAKGMFLEVLREFKRRGYNVACRVLDAQWLGVPQVRRRVIFVGVREDLRREPAFPRPLPYRYTVREALPWIARAKYGPRWGSPDQPSSTVNAQLNWEPHTSKQGLELVQDVVIGTHGTRPRDYGKKVRGAAPTITTQAGALVVSIKGYAIEKEWDKLRPGEASKKYLNLVRPHPDKPCPAVCAQGGTSAGTASVTHPSEKRKLTIDELKRICAFPDDFVFTGTYAQQWERMGRAVPPVMMFHIAKAIREQVFRV